MISEFIILLLLVFLPVFVFKRLGNLHITFDLKKKYDEFKRGKNGIKLGLLTSNAWPNDRQLQIKVVACFGLMVFSRIMNIYIPLCGRWMVDDLTSHNKGFVWDMISMSFGFLCLQGGVYIDTIISTLETRLRSSVKKEMKLKINSDIYNRTLHLPYSYYTKKGNDYVFNIMTKGVEAATEFPEYIVFELIPVLVDLLAAFYFFSGSIDPVFAGVMLVIATIDLGISRFAVHWTSQRLGYGLSFFRDELSVKSMGVYSAENFENIKYFGNEEYELQIHNQIVEREIERDRDDKITGGSSRLITSLLRDCIKLVGTFFIALQRSSNDSKLSTGDYLLFTHYLQKFTNPIATVQGVSGQMRRFFLDVEPLYRLHKAPTELVEAADENNNEMEISGDLRIEHVSFSYPKSNLVLDDVSFEVPEGKTIALVGPSGSGKSTLIRLMFKLLEPSEGSILLNNVNINQLDVKKYRRAISIVPQDCTLLYTSVRTNIQYGRLSADDEAVNKAASLAQIGKVLRREDKEEKRRLAKRGQKEKEQTAQRNKWHFFYDDYDAYNESYDFLDEEEDERMAKIHKMSGGEKQRVAIARAILKNPKYLLLDEATSSLDSVTERQIQKALLEVAKGKTCVIVAHRLSTIAHADNIIVLKNGKVVEQGTHQNLLAKDGLYAEMWNLQQGSDLK
ncbi:unnamed protein product [Bursaphelenchus xylophilus]|uniref:(pine wood nematode) hypothetical protein n=1 Tax=Bursaphelenchus xylophilus TaxID=6326 RepID=A0A1I7RMY2_BURXY|nr:unnamed protein product [Bursaphelenchus xylophilus]CAG9125352.1 unnamed protein product [Bursaphelenchus xylophilus]